MATIHTAKSEPAKIQELIKAGNQKLRVDGSDPAYNDWRDDLVRDGYAVVKGAVPKERALSYASRMLGLAESL